MVDLSRSCVISVGLDGFQLILTVGLQLVCQQLVIISNMKLLATLYLPSLYDDSCLHCPVKKE